VTLPFSQKFPFDRSVEMYDISWPAKGEQGQVAHILRPDRLIATLFLAPCLTPFLFDAESHDNTLLLSNMGTVSCCDS
jgi:hypothetical protein